MSGFVVSKLPQKIPQITEFVPLPTPRPEIPPSIESTMPLESPTEPAGALFEVPRYHPSSPEQIDLLSLPRGLELIKAKWNLFMNWNTELFSQFYGWLPDVTPTTNYTGIFLGIIFMGLVVIWFVTRD